MRLRPLHSHLPPHDLSRSRKDLLFSECLQNCSLHVQFNLSLSSDMTVIVAGTPLGALLVGGLIVAEGEVDVGAVGDKVDSLGGAVAGEPGINVGAVGDKVNGCAVCCRLVTGVKVAAVGDSVELVGMEVTAVAGKGVDCLGCA